MGDESLHPLQFPHSSSSRGVGQPQSERGVRATAATLQPLLRQGRPLGVEGQEVPTRAQAIEQHVVAVRVDVAPAAIEEVRVGAGQVAGAEAPHRPRHVGGHLDVADLLDDGGAHVGEDHGRPVAQGSRAGGAAGQGPRRQVLLALAGLVLRAVVAIGLTENNNSTR